MAESRRLERRSAAGAFAQEVPSESREFFRGLNFHTESQERQIGVVTGEHEIPLPAPFDP